jgi:hypothetical protein
MLPSPDENRRAGPDDLRGRGVVGYGDLLRRLDLASGVSLEAFELSCAVEQSLSDVRLLAGFAGARLPWDPAIVRLRQHITALVGQLWPHHDPVSTPPRESRAALPSAAEVEEVRTRIARCEDPRLTEFSVTGPVVPECFGGRPIDYERYIETARAWLRADRARRAGSGVVGIRTGGSYLAPLWAAVLGTDYVTVRPPQLRLVEEVDVQVLRDGWAWPELAGSWRAPAGRPIVVVDDQLGSGTTMSAAVAAVRRAAGGSATTIPVVHHAGPGSVRPPGTLLLSGVRRRQPPAETTDDGQLRVYFQDAVAHLLPGAGLVVTTVERLPESYWARYLSAATGTTWRLIEPSLRDRLALRFRLARRYRLTCHGSSGVVTLVAKYAGFGCLSAMQAEALATVSAGPPVVGAHGGYLFHHWVPGASLDFGAGTGVTSEELDTMAATAADLHGAAAVRLPASRVERWVAAAWATVRASGFTLPEEARVLRAIRTRPPVAPAPSNHGHWHWVRSTDGPLIRFHRETMTARRYIDPAVDLAATAIELQLSPTQVRHLLAAYAERCGDEVSPGRLALGAVQHAALVLSEYDQHHRAARGLTPVARPRPDDVAPFLHRRDQVGAYATDLARTALS